MLTLHSPFFIDLYFPESHLLKAVVYYENCRYREARVILDEFLKQYEPVHENLKALNTQGKTAAEYYDSLVRMRQDGENLEGDKQGKMLNQILSISMSDPVLRDLDAAYREVDGESQRLGGVEGPMQGAALQRQQRQLPRLLRQRPSHSHVKHLAVTIPT